MTRHLTPTTRMLLGSAAVIALLAGAPSAQAYTITTGGVTAPDGSGVTTAQTGVTVLTFDSLSPGTTGTFTTDGVTVSGSGGVVSGGTAPAGDSTSYLVTSTAPSTGGSETLAVGASSNYFGLYVSSPSAGSGLSFLSGGTSVAAVTGDQLGTSSSYVNLLNLPSFDTVVLSSSTPNFAADNIAFGTVPEPGTLALFGAGLLGIGLLWRGNRAPRYFPVRK